MKAVMLSIQPKWVELIVSGKKTVEVRKTKPKIETPFKCYIYETKDKHFENIGVHYADGRKDFIHNIGKVIGEFVCDKIVEFENSWYDPAFAETSELSCVGWEKLALYLGGKEIGYGWHITDLVIHEQPKELSEFKRECNGVCVDTKNKVKCERIMVDGFSCNGLLPIKRPFQSLGYVEELKGETE